MKITDLTINGIANPIGFSFKRVICCWQVQEFKDKYQKWVKIQVSLSAKFDEIYYEKEGANLQSTGEQLDVRLNPKTRYYYRITVQGDKGETATSQPAFFETGKMDEPWQAEFITTQEGDMFHPVFLKDFTLPAKKIISGRLYVTGLGLYQAYLNGNKTGEDYLAPFCNDYNHAIQYQTYEVTKLLETQNTLAVMLGNGWYKGRLGYEGTEAFYGNRFCTILELHLIYEDGTSELIKTDESWQYQGSEIEDSDIYDGEVYNRCLWEQKDNPKKPAVLLLGEEKKRLVERYSLPVLAKEEIAVKEIIDTNKGETVLDMGQNFAGYIEFHANFKKGTKIEFDFGEVLQQGNFYNENYRTAKSRFTYIAGATPEIVRPHFTFFGFRYVRVTGWPGEIKKEDFIGKVVYSDLKRTGYLETGDSRINRLYQNSLWGLKSNFLDMPTDCPQRDERLGWTGDAQVFAPTACYHMDTRAFYDKFLKDLRVEQKKWNGSVANFIPNYQNAPGGSSVWGDAATLVPDTLYKFYQNEESLKDYYSLMKDWVDYITREDAKNNNHHLFDFGFHFGDWLAQDGVTAQSFKGGTDDYYIASVYYYTSVKIVAETAAILGKSLDQEYYNNLAEQIRQAIFTEYFTPSGRLAVDTQTAYLIALKFGVYLDKEKLLVAFRQRLEKDCYKIKGGFVGAPLLCTVLAENEMEKLAYDILLGEEFPSWLYCVKLGATTIWERWNSILPDGTISGTQMNSLNHYSYGAVIEFLYRQAAGLEPEKPGFTKVVFSPKIDNRLRYLKASYQSAAGLWVSEWKINEDGSISVYYEVPFDASAVLKLPDYQGEDILLEPGSFQLTYQPTNDYLARYGWDTRLEQLAKDERAMAIIAEKLPIAAGLIASGDAENLSLSLEKLKTMFFMGFTPAAVTAAAQEIFQLKSVLSQMEREKI